MSAGLYRPARGLFSRVRNIWHGFQTANSAKVDQWADNSGRTSIGTWLQASDRCQTNMVLRSLLVSLFLCVASGAMPQAAAPSAVPHESNPADAFKQAKRSLAQGQLDQALSEAKLGLARAPRSVVGL